MSAAIEVDPFGGATGTSAFEQLAELRRGPGIGRTPAGLWLTCPPWIDPARLRGSSKGSSSRRPSG